jgi:hypothetical protein
MNRWILYLILSFFLTSCQFVEKWLNRIDPEEDLVYINNLDVEFQVSLLDFTESGRLFYYGQIWGYIKYSDGSQDNWNNEFLNNISKVINCGTKKEYQQILKSLLEKVDLNKERKIENYVIPSWVVNNTYFSDDIRGMIKRLYMYEKVEVSQFVTQNNIGKIIFPKQLNKKTFPDYKERLLGLFDYWSVINLFYVYKEKMDLPWEKVLLKKINRFKNANNEFEYNKEILTLIHYLNDGHAIAHSETIDTKIFGQNVPNFKMKRIDSSFYCYDKRDPNRNKGLQIGDRIIQVNNVKSEVLFDSIKKLHGYSNLSAICKEVCPYMLATNNDSILIKFERDSLVLAVTLPCLYYKDFKKIERKIRDSIANNYKIKNYRNSLGYIDIKYLNEDNINRILKDINDYDTIALDLRGYPRSGVFYELVDCFAGSIPNFYSFTYPDINYPGIIRKRSGFPIDGNNDNPFSGLLILIVDERTQSKGEFLAMALQKSKNSFTIGQQTAGADGNVTFYTFPGGTKTSFSAIGIFYEDMTPTQRVGIKIDKLIDVKEEDLINRIDPIYKYLKIVE